jgi:hypothetical protein
MRNTTESHKAYEHPDAHMGQEYAAAHIHELASNHGEQYSEHNENRTTETNQHSDGLMDWI